jgi:hypothetical protein
MGLIGGAEALHAASRGRRSRDAAIEACHEEAVASGATCYLCHAACHGTTGEGLIRGCSCSGTAGFAHVHCLALLARNKAGLWARWNTCQLCGQEYHGLVRCTLGWHCWALHRTSEVTLQCQAMLELGVALVTAHRYEDAFAAFETLFRGDGHKILFPTHYYRALIYFAKACNKLGRDGPMLEISETTALTLSLMPGKHRLSGLTMMRDVFANLSASAVRTDEVTHRCALELGVCMLDQNLVDEAATHLASWYPPAERSLGEEHAICLEMSWRLAQARYKTHFFGRSDYRIDVVATIGMFIGFFCQSVDTLGIGHPTTLGIWASLQLCFEEQLEWTRDDIPRKHFEFLDELPIPPGHKVFWK